MQKVTTKSGAVYELDHDEKRVRRVSGEINPLMMIPNNEWDHYYRIDGPVLGESMRLFLAPSGVRITTPVVSVETSV